MYNKELTRITNKQNIWEIEAYRFMHEMICHCLPSIVFQQGYWQFHCSYTKGLYTSANLFHTCTALWITMGEHDDGQVIIRKAVYDYLPLKDAPLLPFAWYIYTANQHSDLQPFNGCLQSTTYESHGMCSPLERQHSHTQI